METQPKSQITLTEIIMVQYVNLYGSEYSVLQLKGQVSERRIFIYKPKIICTVDNIYGENRITVTFFVVSLLQMPLFYKRDTFTNS